MKEYILAIDIGTTSAKSIAITREGELIFSHQQFYPTHFSANGFAEQDPDLIFESVIKLIKDSSSRSGKCLGISFSTAMHTLTAVDSNGKVILPLLIWSDTRSREQSQKIIESGLAQKFYEISGTPIHPMSPLCKLVWLKENEPELCRKAGKFLSIKDYILFRLTDEFVVDYSIASATGLFDLEKLQWSEEILSYVGIDQEQFSRPVSVHHRLSLSKESAFLFGIDQNIPLIIGASDGCLAQLGSDALSDDDITITIGTSGAVRVASSSRQIDSEGKVFNYILNNKKYVCGGATNCGTALLAWFKNSIDETASEDPSEFARGIATVSAGSDGLVIVPFLLGERAPVYNPDAKGIFWGVGIHHTKIHFQRALLEGICYQIKWIMETIELIFGHKKNVKVSGGITRSAIWLQMLSDVLGREIVATNSADASAVGAAKLGFESLGIEYRFSNSSSTAFAPNHSTNLVYEKHFTLFKSLYHQVKDLKLN